MPGTLSVGFLPHIDCGSSVSVGRPSLGRLPISPTLPNGLSSSLTPSTLGDLFQSRSESFGLSFGPLLRGIACKTGGLSKGDSSSPTPGILSAGVRLHSKAGSSMEGGRPSRGIDPRSVGLSNTSSSRSAPGTFSVGVLDHICSGSSLEEGTPSRGMAPTSPTLPNGLSSSGTGRTSEVRDHPRSDSSGLFSFGLRPRVSEAISDGRLKGFSSSGTPGTFSDGLRVQSF